MDLVEEQQEEDEIETLNKMMKFYNRILLSRVVPFNLFQEMADSQSPTVTQPPIFILALLLELGVSGISA